MFTSIGHLTLMISLLFTMFSFIYLNMNQNKLKVIIIPMIFMLITISLFDLAYTYLTENLQMFIISINSHSSLPLFYKLAAVWSSHEGSILLWSWMISFYAFLLIYFNQHIYLIKWMLFILIFFLSFTWFVSNPYLLHLNFSMDGLDLNPILQDPFLVIHPPILYLGYIGTIIPFLLILLYLKYKVMNLMEMSFFTFLSWKLLTIGIMLGSWWAYYELGWGGYWFWDPVENMALLPWISLLGLIHSLIKYKKTGYLSYWIMLFSSLSFLMSMIGTFFVSSGLLASVHSFISDNNSGIYLLTFMLMIVMTYLKMLLNYYKKQEYHTKYTEMYSKENLLSISNWMFLLIFILILFGTFMPTFYTLILNKQVSMGPQFYNYYLIPFITILLLCMMLTPFLQWKSHSLSKNMLMFIIMMIMLLEIIHHLFLSTNLVTHLLTNLSIMLILSTIYYGYLISKQTMHNNHKSMIMSHIAMGLLTLAITLNNEYEMLHTIKLLPGCKTTLENYSITLMDINEIKSSNFNALYGNLLMTFKENMLGQLSPELRYYIYQSLITNKSIVISNYLTDMFVTMNEGNIYTGYTFKISYNPFMPLIWLSGMMLILRTKNFKN